jgi:DNA repair exonuclease SbcCD ATPase subunit
VAAHIQAEGKMMSEHDKPTSAQIAIEKEQQRETARSINRQAQELQAKKLDNLKCPTCGYQLVVLDNDELVKLTEKAAYHELRQQLADEREKVKNLEQVWNALEENRQLRDQNQKLEDRLRKHESVRCHTTEE